MWIHNNFKRSQAVSPGRSALIFARRFRQHFQIREALLELAANHFIAIHDQAHGLAQETVFASGSSFAHGDHTSHW